MKMKSEHYMILKEAIDCVLSENRHLTKDAYIQNGFSAMRFRWDIFYKASRNPYLMPHRFVSDVLYKYLNDKHIDTALKKITNTK
jgi:hypothetical protein